jgi:hypothetical protein
LSDDRVSGDSFTDSYTSASFSNKNAATGKSVTATGLNFSGTDAGNYSLSSTTAETTAAITTRALTISAAGVNRVYDGTTSATVTLSDDRVTNDAFTANYTSASFLTKDAATGKSVTATGLRFSGSDAGNYALATSTAETTADIKPNNNSLRDSSVGMTASFISTASPQFYFESVSQPTRVSVDQVISVRPILIPEHVRINRFHFRDFAPVLSPLID